MTASLEIEDRADRMVDPVDPDPAGQMACDPVVRDPVDRAVPVVRAVVVQDRAVDAPGGLASNDQLLMSEWFVCRLRHGRWRIQTANEGRRKAQVAFACLLHIK